MLGIPLIQYTLTLIQISKGGTVLPVKKTYEMVYSPEEFGIASNSEASQRHRWLIRKMQGLPHAEWDMVGYVLTFMVMLLTPDFVHLDDAAEAERMQLTYASLLFR